MKKVLLTVALAQMTGAAAFAQRDSARVPPPRAIAMRCVRQIHWMTDLTVAQMHSRGNRCVVVIGRLLEHDKGEEARQVARRCGEEINALAENRVRWISTRAEHCIMVLTHFEAPDRLKALVREAAEHAIAAIRTHRARVQEQIENALQP
ncbi:MAG: hypothetical protein ACE5HE_10470 [Phycisphaerae bacterium]